MTEVLHVHVELSEARAVVHQVRPPLGFPDLTAELLMESGLCFSSSFLLTHLEAACGHSGIQVPAALVGNLEEVSNS